MTEKKIWWLVPDTLQLLPCKQTTVQILYFSDEGVHCARKFDNSGCSISNSHTQLNNLVGMTTTYMKKKTVREVICIRLLGSFSIGIQCCVREV